MKRATSLQPARSTSISGTEQLVRDGGMGPWALGVPLVLVSALGLVLNAYVLLVVLGLGKQVGHTVIY